MNFETTLNLIQDLLNERLTSDYRKIVVQASNSGLVRFCFTIFLTSNRLNEKGGFYYSYIIRTQEVRNFRNWRPDGELNSEIVNIENLIESFRNNCLSGII